MYKKCIDKQEAYKLHEMLPILENDYQRGKIEKCSILLEKHCWFNAEQKKLIFNFFCQFFPKRKIPERIKKNVDSLLFQDDKFSTVNR